MKKIYCGDAILIKKMANPSQTITRYYPDNINYMD